jgi:hypothetical protein
MRLVGLSNMPATALKPREEPKSRSGRSDRARRCRQPRDSVRREMPPLRMSTRTTRLTQTFFNWNPETVQTSNQKGAASTEPAFCTKKLAGSALLPNSSSRFFRPTTMTLIVDGCAMAWCIPCVDFARDSKFLLQFKIQINSAKFNHFNAKFCC